MRMAMQWSIAFLCLLLATIPFVLVPMLQVDMEVAHYAELEDVQHLFFSSSLDRSVSSYNVDTQAYVWGRTLRPLFAMELHPLNAVQRYTQKKEFVWFGLSSGPWFIGLAILQFNYISVLTVQLYNSQSGESWKCKTLVPLIAPWFGGRWIPNAQGDVGPYAAGHRVEFSTPFTEHRAGINFTGDSVQIDIKGTLWKHKNTTNTPKQEQQRFAVRGSAALPNEFLGFVFPLGPRRAAFVSKFAAAPLHAPLHVRLGDQQWNEAGYLSMDYTRGLLRRETFWHWASATALAGYGFHLSSGTYDINNKSVENTFFTAGRTMLLDTALNFRQDSSSLWIITGNGILLRFHIADAHDGKFHCGIVYGDLHHMWGLFDGFMDVDGTTYVFDKVTGVMEAHYAMW